MVKAGWSTYFQNTSPWGFRRGRWRTSENEPGTSSTSQPFVPVLPLNQGPAASSQGPAVSANSGDENSEHRDEYSARSQDSGRTTLYPDLCILTNDEHWTVTPEKHKCAAAAGSFCFVTTANGEQQDMCDLTTKPSVQRSLCLEEVTDDSSSTRVELPNGFDNETRARLERSIATCGKPQEQEPKSDLAHEKKGQPREYGDTTINLLERNTSSGNPGLRMRFLNVVDLRKFKPKNYVTNRWVLTIKTDKQSNFLRSKGEMGVERIPRQTKRTTCRQILLLLLDQDFGWIARWQPAEVEIFPT